MTDDDTGGNGDNSSRLSIVRRSWGSVAALAVIVTLAIPVANGNIPDSFVGDYILGIVLTAVGTSFVAYWRMSNNAMDRLEEEILELEDEIEEAEAYQHLIDHKNTSPVLVNEKGIIVDINDNGPDEVEYDFTLSALDGNVVDEYIALIGTDREASWEDLNFSADGGYEEDHRRRDFEDLVRFVVVIRLNERVGPDDHFPLSYSINHDVVSPDNDKAFILVREQTERSYLDVKFPEGWEPQRKVASGRGELELPNLDDPEKELDEDGLWHITWDCCDCDVGQSYAVDWTADKVE